ncbi:UvrD-helicase domain-containing protein [Cupriavidus respiraculi]|nr:UvrD-helicase domain-containing protein [Cupriavidus respiraculi]MBY4949513.1 UvrD-helicase domain-containing protein [Cupriavidus respiraculi]
MLLSDNEARRIAIAEHDRALLVEAGAGSGKTAVMAGRIAMMLASGIAPRHIAAVTFTELAASELVIRVRDFVEALTAGSVPAELRVALPDGLSDMQRRELLAAVEVIDDLTCSTIHGFCQRLIAPYPVEAGIDPGAAIMDRDAADLAFDDIVDQWLRERLGENGSGLLADLVAQDASGTLQLVHDIASALRRHRHATGPVALPLMPLVEDFRRSVSALTGFMATCSFAEEATVETARHFAAMAQALDWEIDESSPSHLARLVALRPVPALCTGSGSFLAFRRKTAWEAAAKREGMPASAGKEAFGVVSDLYKACCEAWSALEAQVATRVLGELATHVRAVVQVFSQYKRDSALLDFDDLLYAARALLRDHEPVRQALATRYRHVLVDEFQDTDPLQAEIFWRLCGDPEGSKAGDWTSFRIRPGALFLVGDPKQAIYRFRGADVAAYVQARTAFGAMDAGSVLTISTNFRSHAPILDFVNARFAPCLSADGQPGFTALAPFQPHNGEDPCVVALDIQAASEKPAADELRDVEAVAVARLCAQLIGRHRVVDRRTGGARACRAGDIALLAPTGTDLWRYEAALERLGIAVATQAGKGLYRRQEIQDLIAVTRVLADPGDTLALGALLRGPLVGLSDEAILDIIAALPRDDSNAGTLPRLSISVDPAGIANPIAREVVTSLQALRRQVNSTTPYVLLSQAVDALHVRHLLLERHRDQADRALANVDLYLNMSRRFAVRGLRAFAAAMTAAWTDASRASEGRPDAQEDAVALFTMHAAKGLEWPVVVPVNTMTAIKQADSVFVDPESGRLFCPVFGVRPAGYDAIRSAEGAELERERVRLWYVAATRARELLVLPRPAVTSDKSWASLVDMALQELPTVALEEDPPPMSSQTGACPNQQTRETFAAEARLIAESHRGIRWLAPSRDEGHMSGAVLIPEIAQVVLPGAESGTEGSAVAVRGSRDRGVILHKLMEEVLNGEVSDDLATLTERAATLICTMGAGCHEDASTGLSPAEIAGCVLRTLTIPDIAKMRPRLMAELPVYGSAASTFLEDAIVGVADAVAVGEDGRPEVIIDWKSDVAPSTATLEHYGAQVRSYLSMTSAKRGMIVLMTSGHVIPVEP